MENTIFRRSDKTKQIEDIIHLQKAQFVYVRGRRRIGKSWILKSLTKKYGKRCFYFMGSLDQKTPATLKQFTQEWSFFSGDTRLLEVKHNLLNWKMVFNSITEHAEKSHHKTTIILDEIQWIAKEGSGFIGKLKEAWVDWEQSQKINVIICGSSNKFFVDKTGGEEKILRGLKTQADIIIPHLSLRECHLERFKKWKLSEVALVFMFTGGVPYYLNQVDSAKPFVTAINDAFFTRESIYLTEVDEVISLEFNKQGAQTVKKILNGIGTVGCSESLIVKKTKLPKSTVSTVLAKLISYQLVKVVQSNSKVKFGNDSGSKYIIADFYLNTYFQLIKPLAQKILKNKNDILFQFSADNYFIENYTGPMFERLVQLVLEDRDLKLALFKKMYLRSYAFALETFWDKDQQVDLIVNSQEDRISRAIEVKWQSLSEGESLNILKELEDKIYPLSPYLTRQNYLIILALKQRQKKSKQNFLQVLTIEDLFLT